MKPRKYNYLYVLQGDYGHEYGWVDLAAEDKAEPGAWKRIKQNLREYQENECGPFRIIERRELRQPDPSEDPGRDIHLSNREP